MKILLISIDLILGVRILVSVLKQQSFEVRNLQIVGVKYSDTLSDKMLKNIYRLSKKYDAVGLSFNSFCSLIANQLGQYLKSNGIKWIITGGPHATAMPEETLKYADIAIMYEAELTLPKVLENLNDINSLYNIKGIVFKDKKGRIINTGCPEIVGNIDNLPFQTFSREDITYYDSKTDSFKKPTLSNLFPHSVKNYFLLSSRGCPFKCTYCCNSLFAKFNKGFLRPRKRSIKNIISEMEAAKKAGFKGYYIADDNFLTFTLEEIEDFSKLYRSRIKLPFGIGGLNPNNMRTENSIKKLEFLLSCGLSDIRIGVQSGSNKTLKIFNRKYTAEELPQLLSFLKDRRTIWKRPSNKLRIAVDFICDAPWETEEDKLSTIKMANNLLPEYGVFFYTLVYLPGTDLYEFALKNGWIRDKRNDVYLRGIAGVDDNIYNRMLFLIAVLKERGGKVPDDIISHILALCKEDFNLSEKIIDFIIGVINDIEKFHNYNTGHLTLHPYLKGFNKWEKTVGQKGRKVLFRSYHEAYG